MNANRPERSFWVSLPVIITAIAGLIAAIGGLMAGLAAAGIIGGASGQPTPTPEIVIPAVGISPIVTATPTLTFTPSPRYIPTPGPPNPTLTPAATPSFTVIPKVEPSASIEELRAIHKVRKLTELESGKNILELPDGVYGFIFPGYLSPHLLSIDLIGDSEYFALRRSPSFSEVLEIHKTLEGHISVIGYMSESDRIRLMDPKRQGPIEALFFPEPFREFGDVVSIPLGRLQYSGTRSLDDGTVVIDLTIN